MERNLAELYSNLSMTGKDSRELPHFKHEYCFRFAEIYCRVESLIGRAQFSRADTDIIKSIHRCISLKMLQV